MRTERPAWSRANRPPAESWFVTPAGVTGATYFTSWTRRGLSSELVFEAPDPSVNTARFEALQVRRADFEAAYGGPLDWQEQQDWDRYLDWLLDRQTRLRQGLAAVGGVPEPPAPPQT